MKNISVKINSQAFENSITGMRADLPWVLQQTINDLLKAGQEQQYAAMRKAFTIRNESFLKYSVRIQFATRSSQTGALYIGDIGGKQTAGIWETFEGGGTKTPAKSKYVAVPTDSAWPNKKQVRPMKNKPRNLKNSFVVKNGASTFIFNRVGKKKKSTGDQQVQLMYVLKSGVRIPDKLHFYSTVVPVFEKNYQSTMEKLLRISMAKRGYGSEQAPSTDLGGIR